jgi:4-hydroxy-tetrahydrodipicolinate synthase
MATPCSASGEVDMAALRRLVQRTIEEGAHGLVVGGSTGEFAAFSIDERRSLAEEVVEHVDGRVPVIIQSGGMSTDVAVQLSQHAESIGATAVMPVLPYYEPITLDEAFNYYRHIDAAIDLPIIAYNIPESTGVFLPADFLARMGRELENVRYVKDSTGDVTQLARLLLHHHDDIKLLCGIELLFLPALQLGAVGCILGAVNFAAGPLARIYEAHVRGNYREALEEWKRVAPAMLALLEPGSYVAAVKAACEITGLAVGEPCAPCVPLDDAARRSLSKVLADALTAEPTASLSV